jgi:hypothetical protein
MGLMLLAGITTAQAQRQTAYRDQTWLGVFNQTRFTKHSGVWVDLHVRLTDDFVRSKSLSIARIGYTYYAGEAKLTAGYAYATRYAREATEPNEPEHRTWQQVQWADKKKLFTLMQWLRLEQRFREHIEEGQLTGRYNFNYRARYNIAVTIPFTKEPQTPFVLLNNELHVNFGKEIGTNFFDQNRLFGGIGYQFNPHLNAHLGYLFVFQQLPASEFVHINAIRLFVLHTLNISKKKQSQ